MKTENKPQHTQEEWKVSHSPAARCLKSRASIGVIKSRVFKSIKNQSTIGGKIIANAYGDSIQEAEANAQRIVFAVNIHDELIKALEKIAALNYSHTSQIAAKILMKVKQASQK